MAVMSVSAALSIVTLGVTDLDRAVAFYSALGWRRADSSVDGAISWFDAGGVAVGLFPRAELAADAGVPPELSGVPAGSFSGVTLAINVADEAAVDAALAAAVAAGGTLARPARRMEWGGYSGYVADPDGFHWEFAVNPGFPLVDGRAVVP